MNRILLCCISITLSLTSCLKDSSDDNDYAYFGGEIINPNRSYVTLISPKKQSTDTIPLDENNRFLFKIDNLNPGVYRYMHGPEYQMVVLEPNDSLMLRLNTFDFDESLVYSGEGAKKNNFYLELFLSNEKDNQKLVNYWKLVPEKFDSLMLYKRNKKLSILDDFLKKKVCTDLFKEIAKARINYNYYSSKEIYPFGYYGYNKLVHVKDLPENFYEYRSEINYSNSKLTDTYTYNRFLSWHFNNIALYNYYGEEYSHKEFNRYSKPYNAAKLELIDSLVSDVYLKNNMLKYSVKDYISDSNDFLVSEDLLRIFNEKSTNQKDKETLNELFESLKRLKPGNPIPNVQLVDYNNKTLDLVDIIEKPTVIYFWSSNFKHHYRNSHSIVKGLKKEFPEVNFIAINVNNSYDTYIRNTLNESDFPSSNEFRFKLPEDALKTLAISSVDKVLVLDKNKRIVHSNANLFDDTFGEILVKSLQ
ncbi:hypothetical protein RM697_02915 [Ichthyenterobacterium sp. W332]|uniref:Thioredoxin domain-containing protein n=1 Tax=Microcosmobacter mediterraneus TaxID=3075607 RepID=A0ABU2YHG1_9FLAO|nr:hypothetical protein [Ichthyenterobacterium sp. W332]MDT0557583.1 hypothetical protein [Ichthyenterobacterium sp. W332]